MPKDSFIIFCELDTRIGNAINATIFSFIVQQKDRAVRQSRRDLRESEQPIDKLCKHISIGEVLMVRKAIRKYAGVVCFFVSLLALAFPSRANENQTAFNEFKAIIDNKYIYRDYKVSNWGALYSKYENLLLTSSNSNEFSRILNNLVVEMKDTHFWVFDAQGNQYSGYHKDWNNKVNYDATASKKIIEDYTEINPVICSGKVGNIGYILIKKWFVADDPKEAEYYEALSPLIREFKDTTEGLIIDIRPNNGGNSRYSTDFAKHFVRTGALVEYFDRYDTHDVTRVRTRINDDPYFFPFDLTKTAYEKNVILLNFPSRI